MYFFTSSRANPCLLFLDTAPAQLYFSQFTLHFIVLFKSFIFSYHISTFSPFSRYYRQKNSPNFKKKQNFFSPWQRLASCWPGCQFGPRRHQCRADSGRRPTCTGPPPVPPAGPACWGHTRKKKCKLTYGFNKDWLISGKWWMIDSGNKLNKDE